MERYCGILIILGLLLLVPHAMALDAIEWTITESETKDGWLVAGGSETTEISVKVIDSNVIVHSATIYADNNLGDFSPVTISPASGDNTLLKSKFTPGTKSGSGNLFVNLTYEEGTFYGSKTIPCLDITPFNGINDCLIQIDHNTPWKIQSVQYPGESTVFTDVEIIVRMVDQYNNPVDNKRITERVEFICSKTGSCFLNELGSCIGPDVYFNVNNEGDAIAPLRLSYLSGENIIQIDPVPDRPLKQWITIYGIGEVYPWNMDVNIVPSSREQEVGKRFELYYTLTDRFGNPSPNSPIIISTNLPGDDEATIKTNEFGIARIYYGPNDYPGEVTIFAESLNESVYDESTLYFVAEKSIHVTANPEMMPSLDIAPGTRCEITASLFGGGLPDGIPIQFTIKNLMNDDQIGADTPLSEPYLLVGTEKYYPNQISEEVFTTNGKASVYFIPEILDSNPPDARQCEIVAEYDNGTAIISDSVTVRWRNDPYPSVETYIMPDQAEYAPGQEIDVEIWVIGYGMPNNVEKPVPVDVMLCISRCEQMFENMGEQDKMVQTINVSKMFIDNLTGVSGNRFGLVTCGENGTPELFYGLVGDDEDNSITEGELYAIEHYPKYEEADNSGKLPQASHEYLDIDANNEENGWVTLDYPLLEGTIEIKTEIENITPSAYIDPEKIKPDRYGIYRAIKELKDNPPTSQTIRAVILITDDRKLTKYGEPDARGTWTGAKYDPDSGDPWVMSDYWSKPTNGLGVLPPNYDQRWTIIPEISTDPDDPNQNMAIFAGNNDVRIYVIAIPKKKQCWIDKDLETMYKSLAYTTGGEYYIACDYAALAGAFKNISEKLRVAAAANATMEVGFIEPDPLNTLDYPAEEIFDYIPVPGPDYPIAENKSTQIRHWDWEESGAVKNFFDSKNIVLKDINISQSEEWENPPHILKFDETLLGTVQINESWMSNIRLRINSSIDKPLVFDLFNLSSVLKFENPSGAEEYIVKFPKVPIQINPDLKPIPINDTNIEVIPNEEATKIILEMVTIEWDLEYNGTDPLIDEKVELWNIYGGWDVIWEGEVLNTTTHDTCEWMIVGQPYGMYTLRITASSDDAGYDRKIINVDTTILLKPPYIKVE